MPKPWEQIEADPEFKSLPADRKALLQQEWVAQAASQLPEERQKPFREYLFQAYPHGNEDPAFGQSVDEGMVAGLEQGFQKGLVATFLSGPGAIGEAVGLEDNMMLRAGRQWEQSIEADSPISRENQESFPVKASQAIGQMGSMVVTAPLAAAGTPFRAATMFQRARQLAFMGGLAGASAGEEEAVRLGITDPLAKAGMIFGYGAAEALSERIGGYGVEGGLEAILKGQRLTGNVLAKGATGGIVEGFEEIGAGVPQRGISKLFAQEDPNRPGFTAQGQPIHNAWDVGAMMEEFALGAVAGGTMTGARAVFESLSPQQQQDSRNVAGLPQPLRQPTYEALQRISANQAAGASMANGLGEDTASAMRLTFDGARGQTIDAAKAQAATEFAEGWEDRQKMGLHHVGEDHDAFYDEGKWAVSAGMDSATQQPIWAPAPNTAELEAARQEFIRTGEMPEGMQPLPPVPVIAGNSAPAATSATSTPASATPAAPSAAPAPAAPTPASSPSPAASSPSTPPPAAAQATRKGETLVYTPLPTSRPLDPDFEDRLRAQLQSQGVTDTLEDDVLAASVYVSTSKVLKPFSDELKAAIQAVGTAPAAAPAVAAVSISAQPSTTLGPRATGNVPPRPARQGRDTSAQDAWEEQYGDMRKGGRTHNEDGTPYQPTIYDETQDKVLAATRRGTTDETRVARAAAIGTGNETQFAIAIKDLLDAGWVWDDAQGRMVNPADPQQKPGGAPTAAAPASTVPTESGPEAQAAQQSSPVAAPAPSVADASEVAQKYPNSPDLVQRLTEAQSPAAAVVVMQEGEPLAQLREELVAQTPMQVADRLRTAGVDEVTVARVTEGGQVDIVTAADLISNPQPLTNNKEPAQTEEATPVTPETGTTETEPVTTAPVTSRVQPDEFEARLREKIRSLHLVGWTDEMVQRAVAYHQSKNRADLPYAHLREFADDIEREMQAPGERRRSASQMLKDALQVARGKITGALDDSGPVLPAAAVQWADEELAADYGGLTPSQLAAHAIKGAEWILANGRSFAKWSAEQISRFGDGIRGSLRNIWTAATELLRGTGNLPPVADGDVGTPLPATGDTEIHAVGDADLTGRAVSPYRESIQEAVLTLRQTSGVRVVESAREVPHLSEIVDGGPFALESDGTIVIALDQIHVTLDDRRMAWGHETTAGEQALRRVVKEAQKAQDDAEANPQQHLARQMTRDTVRAMQSAPSWSSFVDVVWAAYGPELQAMVAGSTTEARGEQARTDSPSYDEQQRATRARDRDQAATAWLLEQFGPGMEAVFAGDRNVTDALSTINTPFAVATENFAREAMAPYLDGTAVRYSAQRNPSGTDAEYLAAVSRGHNASAQRMVDAAAKASGLPTRAEAIKAFKTHPLVKMREPVNRVFVIGSAATGKQGEKSDIDILLEIPEKPDESPEQVAERYRRGLQSFFVKNNIQGVRDDVHPQLTARRADLYFTYDADAETRPKVSLEAVELDDAGNPIPLSQRFPNQASPIRNSAQGSEPRVLSKNVTTAEAERARAGLVNTAPTAAKAWIGTRAQIADYFRKTPQARLLWERAWRNRPQNANATQAEAEQAFQNWLDFGLDNQEGFTLAGRSYLITDQVFVYESDGTGEMAARRVLLEEDAHEVFQHLRDIDPEFNRQWEAYRDAVPANELDDLVPLYPHMAQWRADAALHDEIFHEWIAKQVRDSEFRGMPPANSLIGRILQWLKEAWQSVFGAGLEPTQQQILNFVDVARAAKRNAIDDVSTGFRYSADDSGNASARSAIDGDVRSGSWQPAPLSTLRSSYAYNQVFGEKMSESHVVQKLKPLQQFARFWLGGTYGTTAEVTPENTERANDLAHELLSGGTFAADYIANFQEWYAETSPDALPHAGDAAVSVLQIELMDYAARMAAQGDSSLLTRMLPVANDTIIEPSGDASSSARVLQARSAGSQNVIYDVLKDFLAGGVQAAGKVDNLGAAVGEVSVDKNGNRTVTLGPLAASVDPKLNPDLAADVAAGVDNLSGSDAEADAFDADAEKYETEGWRDRARAMFDDDMRKMDVELEALMIELDQLDRLERSLVSKAASAAKASMTPEQRGVYATDPAALAARKKEVLARIKVVLSAMTKADTSHESKEKRKARVRDPKVAQARKVLSADEQAKKLLERYENRNKRVRRQKEPWQKTLEEQVRNPLDEDAFRSKAVVEDGLEPETADRLFEAAERIRGERRARAKDPVLGPKRDLKNELAGREAKRAADKAEDAATREREKFQRQAERLINQASQHRKPAYMGALTQLKNDFVAGKIDEAQFQDGMRTLAVQPDTATELVQVATREAEQVQAQTAARAAARVANKEAAEAEAEEERYEREAQRIIKAETTEPEEIARESELRALRKRYIDGEIKEEDFRAGASALKVTDESLETLVDLTNRRIALKEGNAAARAAAAEATKNEREAQRMIDAHYADPAEVRQRSRLSTLRHQFVDGVITEHQFRSEAAALNVSGPTIETLVRVSEEQIENHRLESDARAAAREAVKFQNAAQAIIDRWKAGPKNTKKGFSLSLYQKQLVSGKITEADFRAKAKSLNVDDATVQELVDISNQQIAQKAANDAAKAAAKALTKSQKEAEAMLEAALRSHSPQQKARVQSRLKELRKQFTEGVIDRAAFVAGATALNVNQPTAEKVADVVELEKQNKEQKDALRERMAEEERLNKGTAPTYGPARPPKARLSYRELVSNVGKALMVSPLAQQGDPRWVEETFTAAFQQMGFPRDVAERYAKKIAPRYQAVLQEAQAKQMEKVAKRLGIKNPTTKLIQDFIRSQVFNPMIANPVVAALMQKAGYAPISQADYQLLAQLDEQINSGFATLSSDAFTKIQRILGKLRPMRHWNPFKEGSVWPQLFVNGALSSLGVTSLNWLHTSFIMPRRLVTDLGAMMGDTIVGAGQGGRAQNLLLMANMFTNLWEARQNFLNNAIHSLKNDAYSGRMLEMLNTEHSLYQELMKAIEHAKSGNPVQRLAAIPKIAWLSSDWVRRMLATADQTWGSVIQNYVIRNEAMRMMVQDAGYTVEAAALIVQRAVQEGALISAQLQQAGEDPRTAELVGQDAFKKSLSNGLNTIAALKRGDQLGGEILLETMEKEASTELGNRRGEKSVAWDIPNILLEGFKSAASAVRKQSELIGRPLTGFISVGANLLNRSFYFTPLGALRVLAKSRMNEAERKLYYAETMATAGQMRARLYESIAGTVALMVLEIFRWRPEDKEWGISVTGNGPQTAGLRDAWYKAGHKKGAIELLDGEGNVIASISYTRGGLDHLAVPLTFAGAHTDMDLEGKSATPKDVDWAWAYTQTVGGNMVKQAQFFGAKALFGGVPTSTKPHALAGLVAYNVQPFLPWGGLQRSAWKMMSGPTEEGSWRAAIASNVPIAQVFLGTPKPAINFLGDQLGNEPTEAWKKMLDRSSGQGFPPFLVAADPTPANERIYDFLMRKGVSPTMPLRSYVENKNGFLTDDRWYSYVKFRGNLIKSELTRQMPRLEKLTPRDLEREMSGISSAATKAAKDRLGLD